jgi:hypothetical protein
MLKDKKTKKRKTKFYYDEKERNNDFPSPISL